MYFIKPMGLKFKFYYFMYTKLNDLALQCYEKYHKEIKKINKI